MEITLLVYSLNKWENHFLWLKEQIHIHFAFDVDIACSDSFFIAIPRNWTFKSSDDPCSPNGRQYPRFVSKYKLKISPSLQLVVLSTNFTETFFTPMCFFKINSAVSFDVQPFCNHFDSKISAIQHRNYCIWTFSPNSVVGRSGQPSNSALSPSRREFVPFKNMWS